jgi:hypothetical protein
MRKLGSSDWHCSAGESLALIALLVELEAVTAEPVFTLREFGVRSTSMLMRLASLDHNRAASS